MNRVSLTGALQEVLAYQERFGNLFLSPDVLSGFIQRTQDLIEKTAIPGDALYTGILGGTGVGKSTLINALARAEISGASDRRPFTDRAVVYRHRNKQRGLDHLTDCFRPQDALHDSEAARNLVLLDLPDYDSRAAENRRTVETLLPHLDAVIWVLSPEKYSDAAFYRLVRDVAIHKKNFTFALNKTDELLLPNEPDPRRKLNEVLGDLLYRLKESAGVDGPVIFCISARCEFSGVYDPILSAEFAKLRDYLAAKWDEKEIAAVKRANVEEQTVRLIEELREHIDPEPKEELVRKLSALYAHTPEASSLDRLTMNDLEERLASALFSQLWIEDTSISPVKTAMRLQHRLKYAFSHPAESPAELLKSAGELLTAKSAANLRQDTLVGRTEALLVVGAHRGLTASPDTGGVVRKAVEDAAERFARETETKSRFFGLARLRRGMQRLALLVPVLLFLARLAGSSADQFLADPGFGAAVYAIGRLLTSFFGGEGLSGLIALLTIEILLIMFLASRRLKKIERASHALALRALEMMQESASRTVRAVYEEKRDESRRMQSGLDELRHLTVALKQ